MYCTQCGAEAPESAKFCYACGSKLLTTKPPHLPESVVPPNSEPSAEPLQPVQAVSSGTWRCSRCGQLNRPGTAACACGQPYEPGNRQVAPTPPPIQAEGRPSFTGQGSDIFSQNGARMLLWYVSIVGMPVGWIYTLRWLFENIQLPHGGGRLSFKGKAGDVYPYFFLMIVFAALNRYDPSESELFRDADPAFLAVAFLLFWVCLVAAQAVVYRQLYAWMCENVVGPAGSQLTFTAGVWPYIGWFFLQIASIFTIIGWAWVQTAFIRWQLRHTRTPRAYLAFCGSGIDLLWRSVVGTVAAIFLLPIPWIVAWLSRWFVENVEIQPVDTAAGAVAAG